MNELSYESIQQLVDNIQTENKVNFNRAEKLIAHQIISSTYLREEFDNTLEHKECNDLYNKEISGAKLAFLLTSISSSKQIGRFGIRITGLTIFDTLDLDSVRIKSKLIFKNCIFKGDISLRDAHTKFLSFEGCKCQYINASRIFVDGPLWLNREFSAQHGVELNNAQINGNVCLSSATIDPIDKETFYRGRSLVLDCAKISGNLLLWSKRQKNSFKARGEISLNGAMIDGNINCRNAKLEGYVKDLENEDDTPIALKAYSAIVKGKIDFSDGFEALGQMLLMNMEVHGDVNCEGGKFSHSPLLGGCQLADYHKHAISFDRSFIGGSLFLRDGFKAFGQIRLIGTTIRGDLDGSGGEYRLSPYATEYYAILIARSFIQGDVCFCKTQKGRNNIQNFITDGLIFLDSVEIKANLIMESGVVFEKNNLAKTGRVGHKGVHVKKNGFSAHNCIIDGWIKFGDMTYNNETVIDLSGTTSVGLLHNWNNFSKESIRKLIIDGFVYRKYGYYLEDAVDDQPIQWLKLLDKPDEPLADNAMIYPRSDNHIGCYQQLAKVLIENGKNPQAVEILIQMEDRRITKYWGKGISWVLKYGIGFGYKPERILFFALATLLIGSLVFYQGYEKNAFFPINIEASMRMDCYKNKNSHPECPVFHPFVYSVEEFFPVINIDLGVKKNWDIYEKTETTIWSGKYLLWFFWLYKTVGWFISTLIVGGFTAYFIRK